MIDKPPIPDLGDEVSSAVPSDAPPDGPPGLPPDPEAYDSARNTAARARGLPLPYLPGGDDPDPVAGRLEERRYTRLLVAMVAAIVLGGFILGFIGLIVGGGAAT